MSRTHAELVENMDFGELMAWKAYELTQGLPDNRLEACIALSGSAVCHSMGAKVKPKDLIPDYRPTKILDWKAGSEMFAAYAKAHNNRKG